MNVQSEKFRLIEWLVGIQDKTTLKRLDQFRQQNEIDVYEANLKPMTVGELEARVEESNKAILEGRVQNIEEILR